MRDILDKHPAFVKEGRGRQPAMSAPPDTVIPMRRRCVTHPSTAGTVKVSYLGSIFFALAFAVSICAFTACTSTAPPPKKDKWDVDEVTSDNGDSPSISLRLAAEPDGTRSWEQEKTPSLHILCEDGTTSFSVWAGEKARGDFDPSYHTMWIQLDDRPVFFEDNWFQTNRGNSVEAPRPIRFLQQVAGAKLLTLKYTDFSQVVLRFDVRGLDTYLPKIAEDCGWKIGVPTGAPKLTEIRKVFLKSYTLEEDAVRMAEEWRQKVQGHTCLQPVAKLKDADAILLLDSDDTALTSKDNETLWSHHMGYLEYKPINKAVGCPLDTIRGK